MILGTESFPEETELEIHNGEKTREELIAIVRNLKVNKYLKLLR